MATPEIYPTRMRGLSWVSCGEAVMQPLPRRTAGRMPAFTADSEGMVTGGSGEAIGVVSLRRLAGAMVNSHMPATRLHPATQRLSTL